MPFLYGGSSGSTVFNTMDIDSGNNMVVGGSCADISLISTASTRPLVIFYTYSGDIKWANYYSITGLSTG
jgi:hypothetical protein